MSRVCYIRHIKYPVKCDEVREIKDDYEIHPKEMCEYKRKFEEVIYNKNVNIQNNKFNK